MVYTHFNLNNTPLHTAHSTGYIIMSIDETILIKTVFSEVIYILLLVIILVGAVLILASIESSNILLLQLALTFISFCLTVETFASELYYSL